MRPHEAELLTREKARNKSSCHLLDLASAFHITCSLRSPRRPLHTRKMSFLLSFIAVLGAASAWKHEARQLEARQGAYVSSAACGDCTTYQTTVIQTSITGTSYTPEPATTVFRETETIYETSTATSQNTVVTTITPSETWLPL